MRLITTLLALGLTTTGALAAETTCKAQATDKKLAGAALTSFMKKCESDARRPAGVRRRRRSSRVPPRRASPRSVSPTRSEPKVRRERGAGRSGPGRLGIERPKDCNRPRWAMSSASFAAHAGLDAAHGGLPQHRLVQ